MMEHSAKKEIEAHLSNVELAELAELGRYDIPERVRAHLERCAHCVAALAEVAEAGKRWRNGVLEASPESWAAAGKAITSPARPVRSRRPLVIAGMFVPAMVLAVLWLGRGAMSQMSNVPADVRATIASSAGAGLVLPGFENQAAEEGVVLRGGNSPALRSYVARLEADAQRSGTSADRTYLLAVTALAEGRLNVARAHASSGRSLHPDDGRFLIVAAVVAYRESDLQTANELLEEARRQSPDDPVIRKNLAIVTQAIPDSPVEGRRYRSAPTGP